MKTFSASLVFCEGNPALTGGFPHKGQWRGASMFSLICAWRNGLANNRDSGNLRRYHAHYDVKVMHSPCVVTHSTKQCSILRTSTKRPRTSKGVFIEWHWVRPWDIQNDSWMLLFMQHIVGTYWHSTWLYGWLDIIISTTCQSKLM